MMKPPPSSIHQPFRHFITVLAWIWCLFFGGRLIAQIDLSIFDGTGVPETEEVQPEDAGEDAGEEVAAEDEAPGGEERAAEDAGEEAGAEAPADGGDEAAEEIPVGEEMGPEREPVPEEEALIPDSPLVHEEPGEAEDGVEETGVENGTEPLDDPQEEPENGGLAEAAAEESTDAPGRATEIFRPTERIPADQSVDFPWDI